MAACAHALRPQRCVRAGPQKLRCVCTPSEQGAGVRRRTSLLHRTAYPGHPGPSSCMACMRARRTGACREGQQKEQAHSLQLQGGVSRVLHAQPSKRQSHMPVHLVRGSVVQARPERTSGWCMTPVEGTRKVLQHSSLRTCSNANASALVQTQLSDTFKDRQQTHCAPELLLRSSSSPELSDAEPLQGCRVSSPFYFFNAQCLFLVNE